MVVLLQDPHRLEALELRALGQLDLEVGVVLNLLAQAAVFGIEGLKNHPMEVTSLQEYGKRVRNVK